MSQDARPLSQAVGPVAPMRPPINGYRVLWMNTEDGRRGVEVRCITNGEMRCRLVVDKAGNPTEYYVEASQFGQEAAQALQIGMLGESLFST